MTAEMLFSPWDTRYRKDIPIALSEQALLEAQIEVEIAWLLTLMKNGVCPRVPEIKIRKAFERVKFAEIEAVEARTQHATRALVEVLQHRLEKAGLKKISPWVHVGLTSFDTVDTAARVRLKNWVDSSWNLEIASFKKELERLAKKYAKLIGVGRTHGQWAVPTVFGLQFAEALSRILTLQERQEIAIENLCGKASGAIGGYHASALLSRDPLKLEKEFLTRLGLKAHFGSVQIIPPEDVLDLAQVVFSMASVATKVANDLRHLARSEIAEVSEGLGKGQVGSSTMPQKRNPWNLEHVVSLHKVLLSRFQLLQLDMITEHQRDLTNSASGRFHAEFFLVATLLLKRCTKVLSRLEIHSDTVQENRSLASNSILAEAYYVLLTKKGEPNAHDLVREAAREAEARGSNVGLVLEEKGLLPRDKNLEGKILQGSSLKLKSILKL
jgi:adenylosuccinate lyase